MLFVLLRWVLLSARTHSLGAVHRLVTWWQEVGFRMQEQSGARAAHECGSKMKIFVTQSVDPVLLWSCRSACGTQRRGSRWARLWQDTPSGSLGSAGSRCTCEDTHFTHASFLTCFYRIVSELHLVFRLHCEGNSCLQWHLSAPCRWKPQKWGKSEDTLLSETQSAATWPAAPRTAHCVFGTRCWDAVRRSWLDTLSPSPASSGEETDSSTPPLRTERSKSGGPKMWVITKRQFLHYQNEANTHQTLKGLWRPGNFRLIKVEIENLIFNFIFFKTSIAWTAMAWLFLIFYLCKLTCLLEIKFNSKILCIPLLLIKLEHLQSTIKKESLGMNVSNESGILTFFKFPKKKDLSSLKIKWKLKNQKQMNPPLSKVTSITVFH